MLSPARGQGGWEEERRREAKAGAAHGRKRTKIEGPWLMKLRALLVMSLSCQSNDVGARAQSRVYAGPYNGNDGHYLRMVTVRTAVA